MGEAGGVGHGGHGDVADGHRVAGLVVDAHHLAVGADAQAFVGDGLIVGIVEAIPVVGPDTVGHAGVNGVAGFGASDIGIRSVALRRQGQTQGHQLGADGVASESGSRIGCAGDVVHTGVRTVTGGKAVDDVAVVVGEVAVVVDAELTHPGEEEAIQVVNVHAALIAHQEKAVALDGHVGVPAGGIHVHGGHIQVDGAHAAPVAGLAGVGAAHQVGAVGAGGLGGVDALLEGDPAGLIAVCIHVGHIVAHHGEGVHVGLQSGNTRAH